MSENCVSKKKVNVLITAVGGGSIGRQVAKALQITDIPVKIIGVDASSYAYGLSDADKAYIVPKADSANYIATILDLCEKENIHYLVPGSEVELKQISKHRSAFEDKGIRLLINDNKVISICFDKSATFKFLKKKGFLTPTTWNIHAIENIENITSFPLIIKPAIQSGGSSNVFIARNYNELKNYVQQLLYENLKVLVQEYIGTADEEYTVGVLTTPDSGEMIGSIALRRLLLDSISTKLRIRDSNSNIPYVISSGFSQGLIEPFPEVQKVCEDIALALNSKGPINIQCRKTEKGIFPFEINPRLSGTTYLRAMVGYNEPEMLIRYFQTGKVPIVPKYRHGYVLRELREKYVSLEEIDSFKRYNL